MRDYKYGDEMSIDTPYTDDVDEIRSRLTAIAVVEEKPDIKVTIPFKGTMPLPRKKYTITDTTMKVDSTITMHARNIHFDIDNNEIKLIGEGSIA